MIIDFNNSTAINPLWNVLFNVLYVLNCFLNVHYNGQVTLYLSDSGLPEAHVQPRARVQAEHGQDEASLPAAGALQPDRGVLPLYWSYTENDHLLVNI